MPDSQRGEAEPAETSKAPRAELSATGERLLPDAYRGELVHAEHIARYHLASRLASGRRILDAACGEGYGTEMLARAGAREVVGVDIDADTVGHAHARYGRDFRVADVTALDLESGSFDLVVSFETIEHLREPERALDEFRRVIGPRGALLISTPNSDEYLVDNEFHLREFSSAEFLAALRERFSHVTPLYQQSFLLSALLDEAALASADPLHLHDWQVAKVSGVSPGQELYTLALCSASETPALSAGVAAAADIYEAHELAQRTDSAERLVREWTARAEEAERLLPQWTARAQEAERLVGEWERRALAAEAETQPYRERAAEAERLVSAWHERAVEAERMTTELRENVKRMRASWGWRLTKPLRLRSALAHRRNLRSGKPPGSPP